MGKHVKNRSNAWKYQLFLTIYEDWTLNAVMKRLVITKATYKKWFDRAIMENLTENKRPISFNIYTKEAFSQNEDDYGTHQWLAKIENTPIIKIQFSELELAINAYKLMLKERANERNDEHAHDTQADTQSVLSHVGY